MFKHLNKVLNNWVTNSKSPSKARLPHLQNLTYPKVEFLRTKEIDKIYTNKVRVSLGINSPNHIQKCIKKDRLADINIMYPRCGFDLRISASLENNCPKPETDRNSSSSNNSNKLETIRCKDRIGYQWDIFTVDISTIHTYKDNIDDSMFIEDLRQRMKNGKALPFDHGCEMSHEVELEITNSKLLANKLNEFKKRRQNPKMIVQAPLFEHIVFTFKNHCLQLCELASRPNFIPHVCALPQNAKSKRKA